MAYEQLKLENQLCFPFYAASRLIIRAYQEDLDALGITYPQYLVMMVLWENQQATVNQIAEKLILNTNTITPLLKRMETLGLITRTPSNTDHRKVMIELTEVGRGMREKAAEIPYRLLERLKIEPTEQGLQDFLKLKSQLYALIALLEQNT